MSRSPAVGRGRVVLSGTRPTPTGGRALVRVVAVTPDDEPSRTRPRLPFGRSNPTSSPASDTPENGPSVRYYLRHQPGWSEGTPFTPDGPPYDTVADAAAAAEELLPGPIEWDDEDRLHPVVLD